MKRKLVESDYQGIAIHFSGDGWINATEIADRFGKRPNDWLELKGTKKYIDALCRNYEAKESKFIKTSKGGRLNGGKGVNNGTLISKELVIPFCLWLAPGLTADIYRMAGDAMAGGNSIESLLSMLKDMDVEDLPPDRYVYVAQEQTSGRYKVGISKDPESRVKQLNIGNPEPLILRHAYLATEHGYLSESLAHESLKSNHLRSEWFDSDSSIESMTGYSQ